eukprot:4559175-Pleurochrysis_carterae.AAC.1
MAAGRTTLGRRDWTLRIALCLRSRVAAPRCCRDSSCCAGCALCSLLPTPVLRGRVQSPRRMLRDLPVRMAPHTVALHAKSTRSHLPRAQLVARAAILLYALLPHYEHLCPNLWPRRA